jgi:hypothetical protein
LSAIPSNPERSRPTADGGRLYPRAEPWQTKSNMVRLLFEPERKVILAEFSGTLTLADLVYADGLVARLMARRGEVMPGILDFSRTDRIDITSEQLIGRGHQPQMKRGQRRILVAASSESYGLSRMFAAFQVAQGNTEPEIVRGLPEAFSRLGLEDPHFEPLDEA